MTPSELSARTKEFAKAALRLCRALPATREGRLIGDQLLRSATAVGANYRAARRGRSYAEFIAKLGLVLEETDEALYWLEILAETQTAPMASLEPLRAEANQLVAIFTASLRTAKRRPI